MATQPTKIYFTNFINRIFNPISNQSVDKISNQFVDKNNEDFNEKNHKKNIDDSFEKKKDIEDPGVNWKIYPKLILFSFKYPDKIKRNLFEGFSEFDILYSGTPLNQLWKDFLNFEFRFKKKHFPKIYYDFIKENPSSTPIDTVNSKISEEFFDYFAENYEPILTIEFIKYQQNLISELPNERSNSDLYKEVRNSLTKWVKIENRQDLNENLEKIMEDLKKVAQLRFDSVKEEDQLSIPITNKSSNQSDNKIVNNNDEENHKKVQKFTDLVQNFEQTGQSLKKIEERWRIKVEKDDQIERLGVCSVIGRNIPHSVSSSMKGFTKL